MPSLYMYYVSGHQMDQPTRRQMHTQRFHYQRRLPAVKNKILVSTNWLQKDIWLDCRINHKLNGEESLFIKIMNVTSIIL